MASSPNTITAAANTQTDTAEAREYNRKRRWVSIVDAAIGFAMLAILLATGWTTHLRDIAWKLTGGRYALALFAYVVMLAALAKIAGAGLDYYGFRLEHHHNLSNQKLGSWLLDELKGWLVGLVLGAIVAELIYWLIRTSPQWWWIYAWLAFI